MGSIANAPTEEGVDQPTIEERRALIDRVAASPHFSALRPAPRLSALRRRPIAEGGLPGDSRTGDRRQGIWQKPLRYDRSQDNIVRVNATELRKRIDLYFATEGAHETLILEIPRGGYKPVFHRRSPEAQSGRVLPTEVSQPRDAALHEAATAPPVRERRNTRVHLVWATVCVALAVACFLEFQQARATHKLLDAWEGKPAVSLLWKDFVKPSQQTDIVLPDASLSIREELTGHPVSLPDYINRQYMNDTESLPVSKDRRDRPQRHLLAQSSCLWGLPRRPADSRAESGGIGAAPDACPFLPGGIGETRQPHPDWGEEGESVDVPVRRPDELQPRLRRYGRGIRTSRTAIRDRARPPPTPSTRYPNGFVGYSVVAYLPNPSHNGNVIILTGTDSDATSAAAEFLTSEEQLKKFQDTLHVQKFPYFEVLLKTSRLSGTSFSSEILAYRTYPGLK